MGPVECSFLETRQYKRASRGSFGLQDRGNSEEAKRVGDVESSGMAIGLGVARYVGDGKVESLEE